MRTILLTVTLLTVALTRIATADPQYDIAIRNGKIVDGSGAPWYVADVGIVGGKIAHIGRIEEGSAKTEIDAAGLVVAPGFIDMMGQTATPMLEDPKTAINLLTQGITTINAGEGGSAAPQNPVDEKRLGYTTMAEYFTLVESKGIPVNVVQTVGHTQVRRIVLGDVDRRPTDTELAKMKDLVREAMQAGAIGVSTALIYPPAVYATTEEIAALSEVAGEYGGGYYTHMRNEGDRLLEAIDEALEIGEAAGTPVHIFHLKAAGQQNWGKMQLAIAKIKAARAEGRQVTADIYPYVNNGLGISAMIHPRHFAQGFTFLKPKLDDPEVRAEIRKEMESTGGWENWFRHVGHDWNRVVIGQSNNPNYKGLDGKTVQEIADEKQEDPWDTFFNLVKTGAFALPQSMTDANKILAMRQEFVSFCTDVGPAGGSRSASHPRAFGSFPRMLSRYVRDLGAISLERAVAQASAVATNDVLVFDRGRISEGLAADVIVFDYEKLTDHANFSNPRALSGGMQHVVVNGELVLHNGEMTAKLPGRVLRGPGFSNGSASHNLSTGKTDDRLRSYDEHLSNYIERHRVPGVSVAVTDQGRLVYARGFGYADIAKREPVKPTSLFRIASLSKPITAVAILQLIEQDKLAFDDKIFEILDFQDQMKQFGEDFESRLKDVTVRHCLEHRGGWDRGMSFDAMFQSVRFAEEFGAVPPANQEVVITAMLAQKLDFDPGERYAYSNFGYCLLGRVIEQLTGDDYESYVKQNVLAPLDITSMRIGKTRLEGRAKKEVRYYASGTAKSVFADDFGEDVPWPYGGWFLESMDSHGGWIASAVDIARFAAAFDDPENCPILSPESIELMYARPPGLAGHDEDGKPKETYYSLGWMNRVIGEEKVNHWHTGSLSGTSAIMIRRHDGKNFVALLNTRNSPNASHLGREIDGLLHKAANEVEKWPESDLFSDFLSSDNN